MTEPLVIPEDLRERHEILSKQLRGSKAQQRYAQFTHELITRVARHEQLVTDEEAELVRDTYIDGCDGAEPRSDKEAVRDMRNALQSLIDSRRNG